MVELLLQIKSSAPHSLIPSGSEGAPPDPLFMPEAKTILVAHVPESIKYEVYSQWNKSMVIENGLSSQKLEIEIVAHCSLSLLAKSKGNGVDSPEQGTGRKGSQCCGDRDYPTAYKYVLVAQCRGAGLVQYGQGVGRKEVTIVSC